MYKNEVSKFYLHNNKMFENESDDRLLITKDNLRKAMAIKQNQTYRWCI